MYTEEDLEKAKDELAIWDRRWDNYSGGNTNKYQSDIRNAASKVKSITDYLKSQGIIKKTDKEILEDKLNKAFPNAKSKEIVDFEGKKYKSTYFPSEMSRSRKTVKGWVHSWNIVE